MSLGREKRALVLLFVVLLALPLVFGQLELPPGLLMLLEEHEQNLLAMNFLVALIGGILALLSPCVLSLIPACVAVGIKEGRHLTKTLTTFFFGVVAVQILFALAGIGIGRFLRLYRYDIALFVGVLIIIWAFVILSGKGLFRRDTQGNDPKGVFLFGILFSFGYTPCVFPVSAAILAIGNDLSGTFSAGMLTIMYTLGLFIPLLLLAFLFDVYVKDLKLREKKLSFGNFTVDWGSVVAGLFFLFFGMLFVLYRGTFIFNSLDPFESMVLVSISQNWLLDLGIGKLVGNLLGIVLVGLLGYGIYRFILTDKNN